jgi:hypothetical protein
MGMRLSLKEAGHLRQLTFWGACVYYNRHFTGYYAGVGYERDTPPEAAGIDLDAINAQAKYFDFGLIDGSYANVIGFAVRRAGGPFREYILFMLANNEIRCGFWGPSIQEIPDCRKLGY